MTISNFVVGDYPQAERDDAYTEKLFGTQVSDPYRYFEDPTAQVTKSFIASQNELANKLSQLERVDIAECPFQSGDYYYQKISVASQEQPILYQYKDLSEKPIEFLNPNTLSKRDEPCCLIANEFSNDGELCAYIISFSGSEWVTCHVKETAPGGKTYEDVIEWCKYPSIAWTDDDRGFFYMRFANPEGSVDAATAVSEDSKVYYHLLGQPQSDDVLVYEDPLHPGYMNSSGITHDGNYLMIYVLPSCEVKSNYQFAKLVEKNFNADELSFTALTPTMEADFTYVTNTGTLFTFMTNLDAPRSKVVTYDFSNKDNGFVTLVPESSSCLTGVICVHSDRLILTYEKDGRNVLDVHLLDTGEFLSTIPFDIGTVESVSGRQTSSLLFFKTVSFFNPGTIWKHDFSNNETTVVFKSEIPDFDSAKFETKQVFYKSKDGTSVPMIIVSRKDVELSGKNATIINGYGAFGVVVMPQYISRYAAFMQHMNGVVALPGIRGGGEYGDDWHLDGSGAKKQNNFDDFHYAAKYLIREKYTKPGKIAINGGSAGGTLVSACMLQAPELYAAVSCDVAVLDKLRFHKFTLGHGWTPEFGNPDIEEDFRVLIKYSPLHNVRSDVEYPAILLTTGDHDDRVVPSHSIKFVAELQHKAKHNLKPFLLKVRVNTGHVNGRPTSVKIEEFTDRLCFYSLVLDAEWD